MVMLSAMVHILYTSSTVVLVIKATDIGLYIATLLLDRAIYRHHETPFWPPKHVDRYATQQLPQPLLDLR